MRIAIVTAVLGKAGGMGRVVEEQALRLAERGHKINIFFPNTEEADKVKNIEGIVLVPIKPRLSYGHAAWLPDLKKKLDGFDVVHLHYPCFGAIRSLLKWKKKTDEKLVVTYHMDPIGHGIFHPLFRNYQTRVLPKILNLANRVFVSSKDYAENGDLALYVEKLRDRLVELPFGVDVKRFVQKKETDFKNETTFLFVGGLNRAHYFKGVSLLLRAFAQLKNSKLILVGFGDLVDQYKKEARNLKIEKNIEFVTNAGFQKLPEYYQKADCFVLPSVDRSEAFGLVLLEAQASGIPVIASDLPGVRTVFEDKKTGLKIAPGDEDALFDAMQWMINNVEERKLMGERARLRMELRYDWDIVMDKLEATYKSLGRE